MYFDSYYYSVERQDAAQLKIDWTGSNLPVLKALAAIIWR